MIQFFYTAGEFESWLEQHGATASELLVGYFKRGVQQGSMTWPESVDAALCFGWIDGVRKRIDDRTYQIRFTPRQQQSTWSAINIARVRVLQSQGRMKEAGLQAYSRRREDKSKVYAYEQKSTAKLRRSEAAQFRKFAAAWKFFAAQPQSYRHLVVWRIVSAKRPETRQRRLEALIEASQQQCRL